MNPKLLELITQATTALQGRKTYIVGWLMVLDAVWFLLTGDRLITHDQTFDVPGGGGDPVMQLLQGSGLMTLRAGLSKTTTPKE